MTRRGSAVLAHVELPGGGGSLCGSTSSIEVCPVCAARSSALRAVHVMSRRAVGDPPVAFCGVGLGRSVELGVGGVAQSVARLAVGVPGGVLLSHVSADAVEDLALSGCPTCAGCLVNFGRWSARRGRSSVDPVRRDYTPADLDDGDDAEFQASSEDAG